MFVLDVIYGGGLSPESIQQAESLRRHVLKKGSVAIRRKDAVRIVHTEPVILAEFMNAAMTRFGELPVGFIMNLFQRWDEENPPDIGDTYATNNHLGSRGGEAGQVV